jgi:hypothetical protein
MGKKGALVLMAALALAVVGCKKEKIYSCVDEFGDVKSYCAESVGEAVDQCLRDPFMGSTCFCTKTGENC